MVNLLLKNYLIASNTDFEIIPHDITHTSMQAAAASHISGHKIAKTVIAKIDEKVCMLVLPASYLIDFSELAEALGTDNCHLIGESQFKDLFNGNVEIGAMSPFGNLHNMTVYVAESLARKEKIAFNAGSHKELILMKYADFDQLVKPIVLHFSYPIYQKIA